MWILANPKSYKCLAFGARIIVLLDTTSPNRVGVGGRQSVRSSRGNQTNLGSKSGGGVEHLLDASNSPGNKMDRLAFSWPAAAIRHLPLEEWTGFSHPCTRHSGKPGSLAADSDPPVLTGFLPWNTPYLERSPSGFSESSMSSAFLDRVISVVCGPASTLPFRGAELFVLSLGSPTKEILRQGFVCKRFWSEGIPRKHWEVVGKGQKPIKGGLMRPLWVAGARFFGGLWEMEWSTYLKHPTRHQQASLFTH